MKKLFLFAITFHVPGSIFAQGIEYTSPAYNYTITIPGDWKRIDDALLAEKELYLEEVMRLKVDYETGFYMTEPFRAPYFLIQYTGPNDRDFDTQIERIKGSRTMEEISEELKEKKLIDSYNQETLFIDRINKVAYTYSVMKSGDISIMGAGAIILSGTEIIQILYFDKEENFSANSHYFHDALNSFKFNN